MTDPASASAENGRRRRFVAPARGEVDPACFSHPLFAGFGDFHDVMTGAGWPGVPSLNERLPLPGKRFVVQDAALLDDGLHYEVRIGEHGCIATRAQNWHDLFNAMVWARHPAIKTALNARQCLHVARMGPHRRNRAQQALTQFDEAGAIVRVRDAALLDAWDRHDWTTLFLGRAGWWRHGDIAIAAVLGHALMEQALLPGRRSVGKCLVVVGEDDAACAERVAGAIDSGEILEDPLELRPLPLAGIPGWHPRQDAGFYAQTDYFRPLREGRAYPRPLT
ncbi:DUF3025 domain-containing protein [Flavobacterium sp. MXW15]|uniref:DUF3025 domain-containing protein n=1 Tax=Xanthomonas chitinilytica TaxID=2989819 RepID=A0ABT3JR49_9XANT|nr:DUF3025 domain-containing protein [Xanthomonas sp. H13-6]MCW4453248.1 DUF3025 domain-containing protein [Flavobacterium sp. MXW15]MCW4470962.1 DUF3025 domain-containing protein [Xanthomonas sp. H13-6]